MQPRPCLSVKPNPKPCRWAKPSNRSVAGSFQEGIRSDRSLCIILYFFFPFSRGARDVDRPDRPLFVQQRRNVLSRHVRATLRA